MKSVLAWAVVAPIITTVLIVVLFERVIDTIMYYRDMGKYRYRV